jgi:RNA polymerase sigma factor (sigma-70 family)
MDTSLHLLSRYHCHGDADAFCTLVRDHAGMVFATARRITSDAALAEDVAQETFLELARSSRGAVKSVAAWLHRVAWRKSCNVVRGESRRRHKEQAAAEDPGGTPDAPWSDLEPLIDEVMEELPATLREPLVEHFLEGRTQQEIAARMGVSQSTISRQLDAGIRELRSCLRARSVISGTGLALLLSTNVSQGVPASLTSSLSKLALSGVGAGATMSANIALHTATAAGLTKAITMTTIQKIVIATTITATLGAGVYQIRRAFHLEAQLQEMRDRQGPMSALLQQLRQDRERAAGRLAALQRENERLGRESEMLAQIKAGDAAAANDPVRKSMLSWLERVNKLKESIRKTPGATIPEMRFLTEEDWLNAVRGKLETEEDYLRAFSGLRNAAESKFTAKTYPALQAYLKASGGAFPSDLSQLQPWFKSPMDSDMLERWEIVPASNYPQFATKDWLITQKAAVDEVRDTRIWMGTNGHGGVGGGFDPANTALEKVVGAFAAANEGRKPANLSDLLPYATTPDQQAALRKRIELQEGASK